MECIKMWKKPIVVCEVGCNHNGNIDIAVQMIKIAKSFCNVDYIKFQKREVKELLTEEEYNRKYDSIFGDTYGKHREALEFDIDQHIYIKNVCDNENIRYTCSVWDLTSTKNIVKLNPDFIKIPSASNLNFSIYDYLSDNYTGDIHISFGMTTKEEVEKIYNYIKQKNLNKRTILYHCISGYPVRFDDICLLELQNIIERFEVKDYGFSNHSNGIAVDIGAYVLGATYIERHFTLDRTMPGTDQPASLEPDGMRKLKRDLDAMFQALTLKNKDILDVEINNRKKLKRLFV